MSSYNGQLSTQPDWHGHYSFLPPGETNIFAQTFEQVQPPNSNNNASPPQRRPASTQEDAPTTSQPPSGQSRSSSHVTHSRTLDPLGLRQPKVESPVQEPAESRGAAYAVKTEPAQDDSLPSRDTSAVMHGPSLVEPVPLVDPAPSSGQGQGQGQGQDVSASQSGNEEALIEKDEDDDMMEDDDMVDVEGEAANQPQTAAERTAARRKMKRFRYGRETYGWLEIFSV